MNPQFHGHIDNIDFRFVSYSISSFSNRCYIGVQNEKFPLDVYQGEYAIRLMKYLGKIWYKTFGDNDWGCIAYYKNVFRNWHRDYGTGSRVLIISISGGWVQFHKGEYEYQFYRLDDNCVFSFDGKVRHKGLINMGYVMFESE